MSELTVHMNGVFSEWLDIENLNFPLLLTWIRDVIVNILCRSYYLYDVVAIVVKSYDNNNKSYNLVTHKLKTFLIDGYASR